MSLIAEQLGFDFFFASEVQRTEDTAKTEKIHEENNQRINDDFSTHPIYQWVKQNAPAVKEIDGEKILKAFEIPGLLKQLETENGNSLRQPEQLYEAKRKTYQNGKSLDGEGERLLEQAARLSMLSEIVHFVGFVKLPTSELSLPNDYASKLFNLSYEADTAFFNHRDTLKHNKDGSLKLEDFGEDLNNTRKGRGAGKSADQELPYDPAGDLEKRLASNSLEKVWPKESIIELHKKNPKAAACLWLVRESLGERRPKKGSYPYRSYLKTRQPPSICIGRSSPESLHRKLKLRPSTASTTHVTNMKRFHTSIRNTGGSLIRVISTMPKMFANGTV